MEIVLYFFFALFTWCVLLTILLHIKNNKMEVVFNFFFTLYTWSILLTFLLPLTLALLFFKSFRPKFFSFLFSRVILPVFNTKFLPLRKEGLDFLKEELKNRDPSKPLEVLEIGIGSGPNLPYYPENSVLTALDVNDAFETYFKENQKKYPQVTFKRMIYSGAEDMGEVEDCSFDVVISTYVLCSVRHVTKVLSEVKRVLKPGGKYLFMEHVGYKGSDCSYLIQKITAPIVRLYCGGCNIDRHHEEKFRKTGFSDLIMNVKYPRTMVLNVRPHLFGIATK